VRERLILVNPVTGTRVPRSSEPRTEMLPFGEEELERVFANAKARNERLAELLLIDAWTGLRWSELRAMRVRDFVEVPLPILIVQVAAPEGVAVKVTKSRKSRRVPVADRVLPMVRRMAAGRDTDAPLFVTESGHRLHATAFKRTLDWPATGAGRRIHDLRHTAACLWLARGVDPVTVQTWMGHASIATTNLYLHHLGTSADKAGLARLNALGHAGGTREGVESE
jgi:integrase